MGIILKQSRLNSIIISLSFVLGAIYTVFIIPRVFDQHPEQWGLIQLMLYYVQIISLFILFSQPAVIVKFYPEYSKRNMTDQVMGFSSVLTTSLLLVFVILWYFFGDAMYFEDDPTLYKKYFLILIPMMIGQIYSEILGAYSRIRHKTVIPFFLNNSLQKVLFFIALVIMFFTRLNFNIIVALMVLTFLLKPIIQAIALKKSNMLPRLYTFNFKGLNTRKILDYSIFGIFSGMAYILIMRIDSLMIGNMLGLDQLAFYSIPVFLVTTMAIPEKAISQISLPVISSLYANKNFREIDVIYKQVSVNQFFLGGLLFLAIWINIDPLMEILGEKFGNTSLAFFLLGTGKLIDLITSSNGSILNISERYRYYLLLQLLLMVLAVTLNLLLIPIWGLNGAALATTIAIIVYNILKAYLVYRWYRIQPFTLSLLKSVLFFALVGAVDAFITIQNIYLSVAVKTSLFAIFSYLFIYFGGASDEIRKELKRIINNVFGHEK
jgi:O-antigen/teichoic acid export membrane protein